MIDQQMNDLPAMRDWAMRTMESRYPDFEIGGRENPYIRRWWMIPRNPFANVYLHHMLRDDDDRALHDHPWENTSFVIDGGFWEVTPEGRFFREPGEVITRPAHALHRLELPYRGAESISLFFTGPKIREWGFQCPQGWRHWREFTGGVSGELVGRGCGEN